jgi:hypothetical protein
MKKLAAIREVMESLNENAFLADGLEKAILGYTVNRHHPHVVVYDAAKCVRAIARQLGTSPDDADEFLEFNTYGAFVGPNGPLFVRRV